MRVYLGSCSRDDLRTARQTAPSHVYGHCWRPKERGLDTVPYFVDNGAFTGEFAPERWVALLDRLADFAYQPDFVVLPDGYNDAEETVDRHRRYAPEVLDRDLPPAFVCQPGLPVAQQVALADGVGAKFVFIGGAKRWQRAHASEIVQRAHDRGMKAHIGNPGGADGLAWAFRVGADSADTSSVAQNQYWHYLERLEKVTHSSRGCRKKEGRQVTLADGGRNVSGSGGDDGGT